MPRPLIVLTTTGNPEQARQLARELVEARCAACVSSLPGVASSYWWAGKVEEDEEVVLMIKTTDARLEELRSHVLRVHPYDVPEFLVLDVREAGEAYLSWLVESTRSASAPGMDA
jgi:periplasmic divalent cation tolerance protein